MDNTNTIFHKIAEALLIDYSSVYYVNAKTDDYQWYSIDRSNCMPKLERTGQDFFKAMASDAEQIVYEEDRHIFQKELQKENLLPKINSGSMQSIRYRLMIDGNPVYHELRLIRRSDGADDYFILGVINISKEIAMQQKEKRLENERNIYNQIAESLAANFDGIYYVDAATGKYIEFTTNKIFGNFEFLENGDDFFHETQANIRKIVYPKDQETLLKVLKKENFFAELERKKHLEITYRLLIDDQIQHTRLTATRSHDKSHFIIGVENINDEIDRERKHSNDLRSAKEAAKKDELTGIKNKNAYEELERSMQQNMDNGIILSFAIVVCDLNDLKKVNDSFGHKAGDEYIKGASTLICEVFSHSPVFRIGGDEFVAVLTERDYFDRERLFKKLRHQVIINQKREKGPILASGMSIYTTETSCVADVFDAADRQMYENKKMLKAHLDTDDTSDYHGNLIPENKKCRLDSLFNAFSLISESSNYVFLCNMEYDFSRWSQSAVDTFGIPSEYMYEAGVVWESFVHPDDRANYRVSLEKVFLGNSSNFYLQYRARTCTGQYVDIVCQGIVIRDSKGEPAYFGGFLRSLSDSAKH